MPKNPTYNTNRFKKQSLTQHTNPTSYQPIPKKQPKTPIEATR